MSQEIKMLKSDLTDICKTFKPFIDCGNFGNKYGTINIKVECDTCIATALDGHKVFRKTYHCDGNSFFEFNLPLIEYKGKDGMVSIEVEGNIVTIKDDVSETLYKTDIGSFDQILDSLPGGKPDYCIAFDSKLLADCLKPFGRQKVVLRFRGSRQVLEIRGENGTAFCMPMNLSEGDVL